jgi:quinol monooxygenase YgiN
MAVKIVALLTPVPGREAELEALLHSMLAPSRAEPGNLRYDLWREAEGERRFVLDELYADDAAVAAHRASDHFAGYLARIGDLCVRLPILVHPVDVTE